MGRPPIARHRKTTMATPNNPELQTAIGRVAMHQAQQHELCFPRVAASYEVPGVQCRGSAVRIGLASWRA